MADIFGSQPRCRDDARSWIDSDVELAPRFAGLPAASRLWAILSPLQRRDKVE